MKIRSCGFSIIFIIISILGNLGYNNVNENNINEYIASDCVSVSEFIENNFEDFVSRFNESTEEKLEATYIENKQEVINVTDNSQAIYLDFDGNNGYAVVGNEYNFLDFAITGDLEYLKGIKTILFSEYDGFIYETEFGYARCDMVYQTEEYWAEMELNKYYDGQLRDKGEGSGRIVDPDLYIKNRYGTGYQNEFPKVLSGYINVEQNDYNNYSKGGYGEGNCTLSAMFGIMQYLRDYKGMNKLPKTDVVINPTDDFFHKDLVNDGYSAKAEIVPSIYSVIRDKAIKYGYRAESSAWTSINMANIYMDAMNEMGYKNDIFKRYAYLVLTWSFESQVKREIDAGYPTMWNTARGQYGAHSMVVKGYKRYYKEKKIWFIRWNEYKNLMILNDNWSSTDIYFDLDSYGWNLWSEGFGAFVQVRSYKY